MRSESRLDSAVFQLTPTRTRCDLVIIANGKTEKIASGLLKPFLAHLRTARDQIAKGGYSIVLEPDPRTEAVWFTKATVERFVRFVSTPEVLERVSTIESEILQIVEAISIQGNENLGLSVVEDHQKRQTECVEGNKSTFYADDEKAIVLYKPGVHPASSDSNGCTKHEENSKVQLLRVLETRKTVLQKEQGMAFARGAAAGFDMDHMADLISFAECFGASRLMDACLQFMELWKGKHENGQWLEVVAAEAMFSRSESYSLDASGIILSGDSRKQKEVGEAWLVSDVGIESNDKAGNHISADLSSHCLNTDNNRDISHPSGPQGTLEPHEYFQGQFQHPTFPHWTMHPPPGPPIFQPYPVQGMPYYQSYPRNGPFFQSPYPPMEDPRFKNPERTGLKRHSMDNKDSNIESEPEMGVSSTRSQDGANQNLSEFEKEASQGRGARRRHGRSRKKQSGVVVIRNINYITSKNGTSGSESRSISSSEAEVEAEDLHSDTPEVKRKNSSRSLKKKEGHTKSEEASNSYGKDEGFYGQEADSGNWQEFQSFLLRTEEKTSTVAGNIFSGEKEPPVKRGQNKSEADAILLTERHSDDVQKTRMAELCKARRTKHVSSHDELLISSERRGLMDSQLYLQFKEIEGGGGGYRRVVSDDFIIYGREKQMGGNSSDPLAEHEYEHAGNLDNSSLYNATDESFMVPFRSTAQTQLGIDTRTAFDMDSKFPAVLRRAEYSSNGAKNQPGYEPDVLMLMPERGMNNGSVGYDPARVYDIQIPVEDAAKLECRNQEVVPRLPTSTIEGSQKSDKEKKSKGSQDGLEKRKKDLLMRKGAFPKLNPLAEAKKRAEKLRAFKADLQKVKKEKEEEDVKRLEALKVERQKRIAARSSSNTAQSASTSKLNRAQVPPKLSPGSYKGSKFSDSEPGSSPLQKLPTRTTSIGSRDSQNTRLIRINGGSSGLSCSVSSLPELKKESNGVMPEKKVASIQITRLSYRSIHLASSLKPVGSDQVPKKNMADEPQKKMSAIKQLDKTKSATLPELRIRTSTASSDAVRKSGSNDTLLKGDGNKATPISDSIQSKKSNEKPSRFSNIDDNPVVEKSVLMLENEKVPSSVVQSSEVVIGMKGSSHVDNRSTITGLDSAYVAVHAPPLPIVVGEVVYPIQSKLDDQMNSSKVVVASSKNESQKLSNSGVTDKPYQAPYARATSLEDPGTNSSGNSDQSPASNSEMATVGTASIHKASLSNSADLSSAEQIQEMFERPHSKESRGFRKLLKFGRKSHYSTSGDGNLESYGSAVADDLQSAASNDVDTLKNLISQNDAHVGGTPPKAPRHFSLLSPFRGKAAVEKKLAV